MRGIFRIRPGADDVRVTADRFLIMRQLLREIRQQIITLGGEGGVGIIADRLFQDLLAVGDLLIGRATSVNLRCSLAISKRDSAIRNRVLTAISGSLNRLLKTAISASAPKRIFPFFRTVTGDVDSRVRSSTYSKVTSSPKLTKSLSPPGWVVGFEPAFASPTNSGWSAPVKTPEWGSFRFVIGDIAAAARADAHFHGIAVVADVVVGVSELDMEFLAEMDRVVFDGVGRIHQLQDRIGEEPDIGFADGAAVVLDAKMDDI